MCRTEWEWASRGGKGRKRARVMCSALETGPLWLQHRQGESGAGCPWKAVPLDVCGLSRTVAEESIWVPAQPPSGCETVYATQSLCTSALSPEKQINNHT